MWISNKMIEFKPATGNNQRHCTVRVADFRQVCAALFLEVEARHS